MMHQSINKKKIYFYLFIFFFISTVFNFNIYKNFNESVLIKTLHIEGIERYEKKLVNDELKYFLNKNIFFLDKYLILEKLEKFNFLEEIKIQKIFPSEININLKKTKFLGSTIINGKKFYIGNNGKFINSKQIKIEKNLPLIFGKFKIDEFLELQNILEEKQIDVKKIVKYYYYRSKRWDFQNQDGLLVMLPSKNIKNSLKIYKKMISNVNLSSIKIVDLRVPSQIILTNEK